MNIVAMFLTFTAVSLFADGSIVVPDGDPLGALLTLVVTWGSVAPLVKASAIVMVAVQAAKKFAPDFKYTKVLVVVGGIIYGAIQSMTTGMSLVNAVVFVLLTSGGAVALYELLKTPLNAVTGTTK